ncbi:MAG: hypothetical protein IPP47_08925 [Bryobacterales bacterium]|nr:hypothetical protein [Bryobacterales bacterium]
MLASIGGQMLLLLAWLLMADSPAVRAGGADLRASCNSDADVVGRLEGGAPARVLFAISGEMGQCAKVESGGRAGYLLMGELTGLAAFEKGRREASDQMIQMLRSQLTRLPSEAPGKPGLDGALELLERGQPRQALEAAENLLRSGPKRDPFQLAVAGLAAYQSDQPQRAVEYWTESLALRADPAVEGLLRKARKELAGDTGREKVQSHHFKVRYDGGAVSDAVAAEMLETLNEEYARIGAGIGCRIDEQLAVIVQTDGAYRASTEAEAWSGGAYDGRIRVVLQGRGFSRATRTSLAHELVHACLARSGRFPRWFHEGMAQRWSGEQPDAAMLEEVKTLRKEPVLGASAREAQVYYAWAWWRVDTLYRRQGESNVREALARGQLIYSDNTP